MNRVLGELNGKEAVVYLDDILIFSKTEGEHLKRLRKVFNRIREASLKLSPEKCHIMKLEINFLGYIIDENGIKRMEKFEAIQIF